MWRLGDLEVDGGVVLGPMSGFTSKGYRAFMRRFGAAVSVTEMVSAAGIIYGQGRTESFIDFEKAPLTGIQLFGSDPDSIAEAAVRAMRINPNTDFFDINMGCPVPKVIRSGSGSALMKDPRRCGDIIRAVKKATNLPVTAKIRLGWDHDSVNFREVIDSMPEADAVTVHARTRTERYAGLPHYDMIEGLQDDIPMPLIVSGNIFSLDDAIGALEISGAAAVMVARGGVGNPFLVTQIDRYMRNGERLQCPTVHEQIGWCIELTDMLIAEKGEETAMKVMRSIAPKFIAGCRRCREDRLELATVPMHRECLIRVLERIDSERGSERVHSECCSEETD